MGAAKIASEDVFSSLVPSFDPTTYPWTIGTGLSLADGSAWPLTDLVRMNKATTAIGNEFGFNGQLNITGNSGAIANYEKAMLYIIAKTSDPSGAVTRDCVGIDTRGIIGAGNTTGRVWGLYSEAQIPATADGNAINEIGVRNGGTDVATPDFTVTGKNKIALQLFSVGAVPATIALNLAGAGTFHKGIYVDQAVLANSANDSFIEVNNGGATVIYKVDRNGSQTWKGQTVIPRTALGLVNGDNNDINIGNATFFRITGPTGAFAITGFANPVDGRLITLINGSGQAMTLAFGRTSSAANQINTTTGADIVGAITVQLIYDGGGSRWFVLSNKP